MKKILSAILAILMLLSVVACAKTDTTETTGTATYGTTTEPTAEPTEVKGAVVYVDASADTATADGTKAHPFASLGDAADAVGAIDRTANEESTGRLASGSYGAVSRDGKYSGTETCPVVILAEDGAIISGGVTLNPADFVPADGETASYFTDEAKSHIVMIDLKQYGVTADTVDALNFQHQDTGSRSTSLIVNGERKRIARYPNVGDYITIRGVTETEPGLTVFNVEKADAQRARTWHSIEKAYVSGWFKYWYRQNSGTLEAVGSKKNSMTVRNIFKNDGEPYEKMVFYVYNIPEELDEAGEYFIDDNAILYYYPEDGFETATITLPINESFALFGANCEWLTVDGLKLADSRTYGFYGGTNHITLKNMEIYGVRDGIVMWGNDNLIIDCDVHDIGFEGVRVCGGDTGKLVKSNTAIVNCSIHDFGQIGKSYYAGVILDGCGSTLSHCDIYNCPHEAVVISGPYNVIEYCEIYNCVNETDDIGAISAGGQFCCYGSAVNNCYIHDNTPLYPEIIDASAYYRCYCSGIYIDGGVSGITMKNNLISNVTGDGIVINGGRDCVIENNVVSNCGVSGISYSQWYYNDLVNGNYGVSPSAYIDSELWFETFPGYGEILRDNPIDLATTSSNHWFACGGSTVKNNVVYASPKAKNPVGYSFADCPLRFSSIETPTAFTVDTFPTTDELMASYGDLLGFKLSEIGRQ